MNKKIILISLLLLSSSVYAGENNHHYYKPMQPIEKTIIITDDSFKSAMATSNAMGGQQFSYGIYGWQGALSIGGYDGKTALAGGIAKRHNGVLYTSSFGKRSYNLTANWTF